MRTIEWEAPALASLAAAHWLVAYERENSPRKRVRYENEIEFDGVAYMLMCEIELGHYKIFCVNRNTGFRKESRIFYFIHLQNEEDYERKKSSSA